MIFERLQAAARARPDAAFLIGGTENVTYSEAVARCLRLGAELQVRHFGPLGICMPDGQAQVWTLLAAAAAGIRACVMDASASQAERTRLIHELDLDVVHREVDTCGAMKRQESDLDPLCLIATSGTTGTPRCAEYRWSDLCSQVPRPQDDRAPACWFAGYRLNHFAGIQLLTHVILHGDSIVVPESRDPQQAVALMRAHQVDQISTTPTFWRHLLAVTHRDELEGLQLRQITLGGEASPAGLLQRLAELFPNARISQIYATTELGTCFTVNDGKPGFPTRLLDDPDRRIALRVRDGELEVRSVHGMQRYVGGGGGGAAEEGWRRTGDMVGIEGDRVLFLGRRSETINVGGAKVHPLTIESALLDVAGVAQARAYGRANPISGAIVVADVVAAPGHDAESLWQEALEHCRATLPRHANPALLRVVDRLEETNHKTARRPMPGEPVL